MTLRTFIVASALAAASGLAQAEESQPEPYQYGMPMNIKHVIAMNETPTNNCEVIDAEIKFEDKTGKIRHVSYRKLSEACSFQN